MKLYVTDPIVMLYMAENFDIKFSWKGHRIHYLSDGMIASVSMPGALLHLSEFIKDFKLAVDYSEDGRLYIEPESHAAILEARVHDTIYAPVTGKSYNVSARYHRPDIQEITKEKFGRGSFKNAVIVRRNRISTLFDRINKE